MVRYGTLWYDMLCYGTIWYSMVRIRHMSTELTIGYCKPHDTHTHTHMCNPPVLSENKLRDQSIGRYQSCYVQQPPRILNRRLFATILRISKNNLILKIRFQCFKLSIITHCNNYTRS